MGISSFATPETIGLVISVKVKNVQWFCPHNAYAANSSSECFIDLHQVVILDSSGHQIKQLGLKGKRTELNIPTSVALLGDSVVVADSGNHRIKIFNIADGEKQFEFGSLGRNPSQFRSAEIVAVDPLGFVLVGDAGNARIQVFRPDGSLVRVFTSSKFGWISGMQITPELDIIITDIKHRRLQIF